MKQISSGFILGVLAAVLNIGMTLGLIYFKRESILSPGAAAKPLQPRFWSFRADEVDALISELMDQQAKLLMRQSELDKAAAHIDAERQELEKTRADVGAMQDAISAEIPEIQESERKNLKTLAQTYANMSPAAAVAIFRDMDESACVKLLSQMKPDKVAPILEEMSQTDKDDTMTKRAASISDKLRLMKTEPKPQT